MCRILGRASWLSWTFAALFFAGCGGDGAVVHSTHPVKGTVTYQGKPVPRGNVRLDPVDLTLPSAYGVINADGSFVLRTYVDGDGAVAGEHSISVVATTEQVAEFLDEEETQPNPDYKEPETIIPIEYASAETTPLEQFRVEEKENELTIELEEQENSASED